MMNELKVLFSFGLRRRINDSFLISYGIIMPLIMILLLGYLASGYYTGIEGISSYSYYTVVSLPLYTFFSSITLIYVAREEQLFNAGSRFIVSPIHRSTLVLYKILPSTLVIFAFNLIVMLACKLLFKVNFQGQFLQVLALLGVFGYMSCSLGTFIGLCTKNFMTVKNLVSTPLLIMGFLGGSFFPIGSLGKGFLIASYFSPLTYVNQGLFKLLYDHNNLFYIFALCITLFLGIIFTVGSTIKMQKEAFI